MNVLIAEDDPIPRRMLQAALVRWGYDVRAANDGDSAWAVLQEPDAPNLVILDWLMPGIDGVEICRRLRARPAGSSYVYVILLTARDTVEDSREGREAGADDYLTKPFDPQELQVRLRTARRILQLQSDLLAALDEQKRTQEELRRAEEQYRLLFENAVEGIYRTTPAGSYLQANPMLARIYGYEDRERMMAELVDIGHQLYVDPERRAVFQRRLAEKDAVQGFESEVRRKDGSVIWIRENARAVRDEDGKLICYEGTVEDITGRKQMEAAERRYSIELEERVRRRTAELATANEALRAENAERRRAEAELENANRLLLEAAKERKRYYREVIERVSRGKFRLVDAADLAPDPAARIDMPLESAADCPAFRAAVREFASEAGMSARDVRDFELAVGEAITNAYKHAVGARGIVWRTDDRVVVRVVDHGSGISDEDLPATLLQPGFSTKVSLGMGYTLILEMVDAVWLATEPEGTIVQLEKAIHPDILAQAMLLSAWEKF